MGGGRVALLWSDRDAVGHGTAGQLSSAPSTMRCPPRCQGAGDTGFTRPDMEFDQRDRGMIVPLRIVEPLKLILTSPSIRVSIGAPGRRLSAAQRG